MRKLITILSFLIPVLAFSQNEQYIGTSANIVKARGGLMSDSSYYLPARDTTFIPVRNGAVIFRSADNQMYVYNGSWGYVVPSSGLPVNAAIFGMSGNGVTDNSLVFKTLIAYAAALGRDIFIPHGVYFCNTLLVGTHVIDFPTNQTANPIQMRIYGEKQTIITSTLKSCNLICLTGGNYQNITFENLQFISTHDTTTLGATCIFTTGIKPYFVRNLIIKNCVFKGWSTAITLKGTHGVWIENNFFASPLGHDNNTTTTAPATFISLVDDSVGDLNKNIWVENNLVNGYDTTISITTTKTQCPSDNFVFGHASGYHITGNTISNLGQEYISVQPRLSIVDTGQVIITGNILNCHAPAGSLNILNGLQLRSTTGIRCDAANSVISNNTLKDVTNGILDYATGSWNFQFRNWHIENNTIRITNDTSYNPQHGITIQGFSSSVKAKGAVIAGNDIYIDSVTLNQTFGGISLAFVDSSSVIGNSVIESRVTKTGGGVRGIDLFMDTALVIGSDNLIFNDTSVWNNVSTVTGNFNNQTGLIHLPNTHTRWYSTNDEGTNFAYGDIAQTGTSFIISSTQGGSGTIPVINITAGASTAVFTNAAGTGGFWQFNRATGTANAVEVNMGSGTWSIGTGVNTILQMNPTWNQTSTAGFTTLLINNQETQVGSGLRKAIDVLLTNTSKFFITDSGSLSSQGIALGYNNKAADYIPNSEDFLIEVTATGHTVTLPAANVNGHKIFVVKYTGASGSCTVASLGGTIDGATTFTLSATNKYAWFYSNGTNYLIIGNN